MRRQEPGAHQAPAEAGLEVMRAIADQPDLARQLGEIRRVRRLPGLSNRVYDVETATGRYVLRVSLPQTDALVDRSVECHNLHAAAAAGLSPAPVFADPRSGLVVLPFVEVSAGPPSPAVLGGALRRLHGEITDYRGRRDPRDWAVRLMRSVTGHPELHEKAENTVRLLNRVQDRAQLDRHPFVPSHWDVSDGNCLTLTDGVLLIDWEYSALGPRSWDLAYAALEFGYDEPSEAAFLAAYTGSGSEISELAGEVRAMKVICDAISALWALTQQAGGNDAADFQSLADHRAERARWQLERLSAGS
ncbi:MAG: phosphotransferase family protein [Roseibium sp.]|nr:phosphotransferase family protein [Roseibium sp.]